MAILAPYGFIPGRFPTEIASSIGGDGNYLCPHDPQHNTSGEDGFYSDTHLGGDSGPQVMAQGPAPSDFQHARDYQYTPVVRGWVATQGGYVQGPYYPQPARGAVYPMSPAMVLGDAEADAAQAAQDKRRKDVMFWMQVITGTIIGSSALLAIFRTLKGLSHDTIIRDALGRKLL